MGAGGKCSCTIWLAVRVEKALPPLERYAPVTAFAIAAATAGTSAPCSPASSPAAGNPPICLRLKNVVARAPFIWNTPSTLPTRSVTAITEGSPRASASPAACAMICSTSPIDSASCRGSAKTRAEPAGGEVGEGVGADVPTGEGWLAPSPPPQELRTSAAAPSKQARVRAKEFFRAVT